MKKESQTKEEKMLEKFYGFKVKVHPLKYLVILIGAIIAVEVMPENPYATFKDYFPTAVIMLVTAIFASMFEKTIEE